MFNEDGFQWHAANIINSFSRVCVPLFFMISGFFFMKNKEVKTKNILKLLCNLVLYTSVAVIYIIMVKSTSLKHLLSPTIFFNTFEKPLFYHLWFFYKLLICYFIFSAISIKTVNPLKIIAMISAIFIFFNPTTSIVTSTLFGFSYGGIFTIGDQMIFYVLYGALGASIGAMEIRPKHAYIYLLLFFVFSILTAAFTYSTSMERGGFSSAFYSYTSLFVMLASVFIFLFFKAKGDDFQVLGWATKIIASASLPIYGIHAFILEWLLDANLDKYISPFGIPLTFIIIFIPSLAYGILISKVDRKGIFH